jgi:hypothetical protein
MNSSRQRRNIRKRTIWEELPINFIYPSQIAHKKARRTITREALKPIVVKSVSEPALLDETLPPYIPPLKLNYLSGISESKGSIKLDTLKNLFPIV